MHRLSSDRLSRSDETPALDPRLLVDPIDLSAQFFSQLLALGKRKSSTLPSHIMAVAPVLQAKNDTITTGKIEKGKEDARSGNCWFQDESFHWKLATQALESPFPEYESSRTIVLCSKGSAKRYGRVMAGSRRAHDVRVIHFLQDGCLVSIIRSILLDEQTSESCSDGKTVAFALL